MGSWDPQPLRCVHQESHLGETRPDSSAIPFVSTTSASMRREVVKLFKELREIMDKFSPLLIALLAANNTTGTGANTLFKNQHDKLMMLLVLIIVFYYLTWVFRTVIVQLPPHNTHHLHILTFIIIALFASSASVLALAIN